MGGADLTTLPRGAASLNLLHERPPRRPPCHRARAAQSDRRRRRRQHRQGAPRARRGRAGRRPRDLSRAVHRRLSAGRPRAQAGVPGRLPRGGRSARARDCRRRPGRAGRHALGRGRQALQCLSAARRRQRSRPRATRSTCRTTACSTRSACSRRGRCPDRSCSRACASAFRSARTSGSADVVECIAETGGEILLVPNGSPYWRDKTQYLALSLDSARVDILSHGRPENLLVPLLFNKSVTPDRRCDQSGLTCAYSLSLVGCAARLINQRLKMRPVAEQIEIGVD